MASCGGGTSTRTRTVTTPASNGGLVCPSLTETVSCNTQPCATVCNAVNVPVKNKVWICHSTGSEKNTYELISVSSSAVPGHLKGHGPKIPVDILPGTNGYNCARKRTNSQSSSSDSHDESGSYDRTRTGVNLNIGSHDFKAVSDETELSDGTTDTDIASTNRGITSMSISAQIGVAVCATLVIVGLTVGTVVAVMKRRHRRQLNDNDMKSNQHLLGEGGM